MTSRSRGTIASQALDLIARLEEERAELDNDLIRQIILPVEARHIRQSIDAILVCLKAMVGLSTDSPT